MYTKALDMKNSINRVYQYVQIGDNRAPMAMKNFLKAGIDAPFSAYYYMNLEKKNLKKLVSNKNSNSNLSFYQRFSRFLSAKLRLVYYKSSPDINFLFSAMNDNFKTFYPKTGDLRKQILKNMLK